ncbi:hypothetical protein FLONG3_1842 [Fusarium longipes]|uniref:Uncharacterized protein n=1 Tax=Fusarium longipes TaxID=694270 RepID=A0A395T5W9_9HYPO|nr:hypothetical protein FLONG3_1842 [Fusarium longipes]
MESLSSIACCFHGIKSRACRLLTNTDQQSHRVEALAIFETSPSRDIQSLAIAVLSVIPSFSHGQEDHYFQHVLGGNTPAFCHEEDIANLRQVELEKPNDPKSLELEKNPLVHLRSWKLRYNKEVEDRMRDQERPAPESLPTSYRYDEYRNAASRPTPISGTTSTNDPQDLSLENQVRVKLMSSTKRSDALNPHYESNALLRETRDQLDSVDRIHNQLKKSFVDLKRMFKPADNKKN